MCVFAHHFPETGHQPGNIRVLNLGRGQRNRENIFSPVPVLPYDFGPARQIRLSRPASVHSFFEPGSNLVYLCNDFSLTREEDLTPTSD